MAESRQLPPPEKAALTLGPDLIIDGGRFTPSSFGQ